MDAQMVQESVRAWRYVLIRILCRISDLIFYTLVLWYWGEKAFVYAFALSTTVNLLVDFWGQKFWAFEKKGKSAALARQITLFLVVRVGNISAAFGTYMLLTEVLGVAWWMAGLFVLTFFAVTRFALYHLVFLGSFKELNAAARKIVKTFSHTRPRT